jgi:phytol kinase
MMVQNALALVATLVLALAWLRINDFAAHRGWISSSLSRKIIHIGTGPLFVLCWLMFPADPWARYFAAIVPLGITAQFALVGSGVMKDPSAVEAMSRSGRREEILRGPLYYGIVFVALTLLFWKDSPVGIVALMLLCGGDGLADIIGTRYGLGCLPWSCKKSYGGSLAMFLGGLAFSGLMVAIFTAAAVLPPLAGGYFGPLALIAMVGMLVESLPVSDLDNITVPAVTVLLGLWLFRV